jgi:hypothetical protein
MPRRFEEGDCMSDRTKDLGEVVATWREDAAVLRARGYSVEAERLEAMAGEVFGVAEDFITWLSEDMAFMKSGLSRRTLRRRFRELLDCGLARYNAKREKEFRSCAIPQRANAAAAKAAGLAGESLRSNAA